MGKEILQKFKQMKFTAIRLLFIKDLDIEEVLVSNQISFGKKNYKYFIGYLYNDHKVKSLHIMLPKTSAYVKVMMDKLNGCIF